MDEILDLLRQNARLSVAKFQSKVSRGYVDTLYLKNVSFVSRDGINPKAFRSGNLGIMDYYRMKNIEADTQMRDAIAKPQGKEQGKK